MTEAEIRRIVSETVDQTLLRLGIDATEPLEVQKDFQHVRQWREAVGTVKRQGMITAIGILTAGILGAVWVAIKGTN